MLRRLAILGLAALSVAGCGKKKSGPAIAKGDGFTITADDFKARIEEQSPFMRARYNTLEHKKEFVENLIRFEVLAREAEKQGFRDDPDVQQTIRKIMVQKLVQKRFAEGTGEASVADADVQKFYEEHAAEYHRPKRVRVAQVALLAASGTPERAKKAAAAKKALASLQAAEKDPKAAGTAFAKAVAELSEDAASKAAGGDLGLKTQEELAKATSPELAAAAFGLKQGETSGVVETPAGLHILKATLVQEEVNRTLDQVKPQIVSRLSREKKAKEFEEWLKKLRETAKVTIDEKALEAVQVTAPPPPPGMNGDQKPGLSVQPAQAQPGVQKPAISVQPAPATK
jgi:peptidyl-prolyl cis-trans isomerase C